MNNDNVFHDWMVSYLRDRLARDYDTVRINPGEVKNNDFKGHYPDLILENHGLVLAIMEVETEGTISRERADEWKNIADLGAKLILMVPRAAKAKVIDLLWKQGLAGKASVGTYDIAISMP